MKMYYVDVVCGGIHTRVMLSEPTWSYWSMRCANHEDNPFAKGTVLCGLSNTGNPICLRTKDISIMQFCEGNKPLSIKVKEKQSNPLNEDCHYENPLS